MRKTLPQRTLVNPAGNNDIGWVKKFLVDKSPRSQSQARRPVPAGGSLGPAGKTDEELMLEIQRDVAEYHPDKYRSALLRIKQKNRAAPQPASQPLHDYQSKKRLATMTLLKNKVPQLDCRDDYLQPDQVYKLAADHYKRRLLSRLP